MKQSIAFRALAAAGLWRRLATVASLFALATALSACGDEATEEEIGEATITLEDAPQNLTELKIFVSMDFAAQQSDTPVTETLEAVQAQSSTRQWVGNNQTLWRLRLIPRASGGQTPFLHGEALPAPLLRFRGFRSDAGCQIARLCAFAADSLLEGVVVSGDCGRAESTTDRFQCEG